MVSKFNLLLHKLDKFIKRYYKNLIIRGVIYFAAITGIVFLLWILLEYYGYFSTAVRGILFYTFICANIYLLIKYILNPLLKLFKIGKVLDNEEAARLVGRHFRGIVDDKIVNVIQLHKFLEKDGKNVDLLIAGINQKSEKLINVQFENVIRYNENLKYLFWAVVPAFIITFLVIFSPFVVYEPAKRIVQYRTPFERAAPFSVYITNENLTAFQNDDFKLKMEIEGNVLPQKVMINYDNVEYLTNPEKAGKFNYVFRNIQKKKQFIITAGGFQFGPYELDVVPKPVINNFVIVVSSPDYTGIEDKTYRNYGDISVAAGSEINMRFNTRFADSVIIVTDNVKKYMGEKEPGIFEFSKVINESIAYKVSTGNEYTDRGDSLKYSVNAIPDRYPEIAVSQYEDSVLIAHRFFSGQIRDDYGFEQLKFKYRVIDGMENQKTKFKTDNIDIDENATNQTFMYHFDLNLADVLPGNVVEYYFAVWDNDAINGPKKTSSRKFSYQVPGYDEIAESAIKEYEEIGEDIGTNITEVSRTRDDIDDLRKKLLERDDIGWEEKEAFRELAERYEKMKERMDELSEKKKESEFKYEQLREKSESIKKKQEEIQRIFDEAVSDELKELFEKIAEELEKLGRDEMYEYLEKMDFEFSHFHDQLDRVLELFKMLEFENILQESIERAERLKEEQQELMEDVDQKAELDESLFEEQKDIKESFDGLSELLEKLEEKNRQLKRPQNIPDTRDVQHNIDYDLRRALEEMLNRDHENTLKHQNSTVEGMDQLSQMLQNFQSTLFQQELAEDARLLRQLLQNLLKTSFNQEDLMKEVRSVNINDPRYVEMIQDQRKIFDDLRVIEDSLTALSKRQVQIESYINREIAGINMNIEKAIKDMINRRRHAAASRQQFVMTHVNNLALMLNESLQNMQMQLAMQEGFGQPMDNGQGMQQSMQDIIDMQEAVNEMLQEMREGHQPVPGETGEETTLSEQLARMSMQQEDVRNKLRELTEELRKELDFSTRELEQIQRDMERTELDIVTRNITRQTILRQERILTRLLEHDRALMKRDFEDERVGEIPEFYELSNPEDIFEYNRLKEKQIEMLKMQQMEFNRFYNNLIETYFIKFRE